ncbi:hypothetical protein GVN21_07555 [Caulobacter sp. SLTY]|uniref:hypothetical protein n=1 Tax=Caulobacter sp. SLTY TaxID=2683262 RepID=UPI0014126574|nr:hypothetical protein [Caulobacter sp. SLTY]NBB15210.1 hypothetical protein [Caulobacter sp. SLTY]
MDRRSLIVAAPALWLGGCQDGVEVQVSGPAEAPLFRFRRTSPFGEPNIEFPGSLEITEDGQRIWAIRTARVADRRPTVVRYGEVPAGGQLWGPPATPLAPRVIYDVRVFGRGFSGAARFRIENGRAMRL